MKIATIVGLLSAFVLTRAPAATLYVDAASTSAVPPFTNWTTAAANIQDTVDAAAPGDEIVVTNGVYQTGARAVYGMSNRVAVTKPVTVRSVNGPAYTSIVGYGPVGENAIRCVYLTNGAVLAGFTLTNGATLEFGGGPRMDGGGLWCAGLNAVASNCVLIGNSAAAGGGGISGGTLNNCKITHNSAAEDGGGAHLSTLNNCVLTDNSSGISGGGAFVSTLNNCIIAGNTAATGGGVEACTLNQCTLTGNSANFYGGAYASSLNNCIVYYNSAPFGGANYDFGTTDTTFNNSCTTPAPESGVGNITNAPLFMDTNGWSNLRLQSNSPCINAGHNASVVGNTDLDGHPRIAGGAVDIGAYEWQGTTRYVSAASTNPVAPYSSWATAAVTIQDAVDAAADGDEIVVTNGVYATGGRAASGTSLTNRVCVDRAIALRSVNGPESTFINGMGNSRCVYLTNGAAVTGFTLTNGATQFQVDFYPDKCGGGAWCEGLDAVLSNCVVAGCWAYDDGGGVFGGTLNNCVLRGNEGFYGGGAFSNALNDCTLSGNFGQGGGGAYASTLTNCTLTGNFGDYGGGAYASALNNCTLSTNRAANDGGGAWECALKDCTLVGNRAEISGGGADSSTLTNCTVTGNSVNSPSTAFNHGGGVASSTLENCLVMGNSARDEFGVGGGAYASTLNNCSLMGNSSRAGGGAIYSTLNNCMVTGNLACGDSGAGGGAHSSTLNNCTVTGNSVCGAHGSAGGGVYQSALTNCIIYYNSSEYSGDNYAASILNHSCTTPAPASGTGNITNAPLFVDTNGWSNLRLQSNSPCINAGNNAYVTAATDLDGFPRIVGGSVDIGAYEFQSPASTISYAWLQQSGLPADGSADVVDTDHDGHNNWQEWMAGTDPTNALSVLWLAAPVLTPTNVTLTWTSVTNRIYTLEQATNLGGAAAFSVLRSNLLGLPGTTSWTDTNAPVSSPRFYQLRVSP